MRVVYALQYQSERERLSRATRLALDFAEQGIANDPSLGHHRRETGDGAIVDYSVEDVWIRYRRLTDEVIEFERVIDLRARG
jgi:DNA-binding transcriptional ArsR family regulator